ncbi:MAG: DUF3795 domain-containing protein [Roseburia sp.]
MIIETYCGLNCSECEFKESQNCGGCIATEGKPFYGFCEVAECAVKKGKRFCGECENFSCEILNRYSFDPEHGDNGERIENCKKIKAELVAKAREGINPVSVCGHHCDYCFMGQWCGGCRSDYNCCSYATLFEDKKCPNVKCAERKQLEGCFDCSELENCNHGFYGLENEYVAKATALFIRKYGQECYAKTLKKAIDSGEQYAQSFNELGSVEGAYKLLEKYL